MPDGAVIIAAITSCTNTSNPRNVVAAALLARNANKLGLVRKPWVKSSLAPGSKVVKLYLKDSQSAGRAGKAGLWHRRLCLHHLQRHVGRAGSQVIQQEIIDRDLYATAVLSGNRNFDGRIHPYAKQAFLASPPLVVAYAMAGTVRFDIEHDVLGGLMAKEITPERPVAQRRRDRRHRCRQRQARAVPRRVRAHVRHPGRQRARKPRPQYDWRPQSTYIRRPPYWDTEGVGALAAFPRTLKGMRPLAILPDNITTDHLSPSNAILMTRLPVSTCTRWACPRRTSTPTPPTAATT
jgi:aconitase A